MRTKIRIIRDRAAIRGRDMHFFRVQKSFFCLGVCENKNFVYICSPKTKVSGPPGGAQAQSEGAREAGVREIRRDAGVVDRAALEMRCTGNCTGGSNPSLSAKEGRKKAKPVSEILTGFFR